MLQAKRAYIQVRLIDKAGNELVRVDRVGEKTRVVPRDLMQNKHDRRYVSETIKLPAGSIYLSEINLNREHGRISEPYMPVLRAATPVYDNGGELFGLVVINMDFGRQLDVIKRAQQGIGQSLYVTNSLGSYLVHPNRDKEFGFDLGHDERVQRDFPQLTNLFSPTSHRTIETLLPEDTGDNRVRVFVKIALLRDHPERFVTVGLSQPYDDVIASQSTALANAIGFSLLLIVIGIAAAYAFSGLLVRPIGLVTQRIDDFMHGRETGSLPIERSDEIGMLARAFRDLERQVRSSEENLQGLNRDLEGLVVNRTRELTRFKNTLDLTMDCVLIFSAERLEIFYANQGAVEQVGFPREMLLNMKPFDVMPLLDEVQFRRLLEPMLSGELSFTSFETVHRSKAGVDIPVEVLLQYIAPEGEQARFVAIIRDITERNRIDQMKSDFISTVSHELRTPLTSIRGALGLLVGGAAGDLPKQQYEMVDIAHKNSDRLIHLINDLLDMEKITSGKMEFNNEPQLLMPLVDSAMAESHAYAQQFGVEYQIVSSSSTTRVNVDSDRLRQVLFNLLSNAAKFSAGATRVEIAVIDNGPQVRVAVTDYGGGIPVEFRNQIFEKFTQADASSTRSMGGTGLGLTISKSIIAQMGGTIGFETEVGRGTTFYFELQTV
ncbi:ATP-binding protein [Solemya pervernicosa gill symbiont]